MPRQRTPKRKLTEAEWKLGTLLNQCVADFQKYAIRNGLKELPREKLRVLMSNYLAGLTLSRSDASQDSSTGVPRVARHLIASEYRVAAEAVVRDNLRRARRTGGLRGSKAQRQMWRERDALWWRRATRLDKGLSLRGKARIIAEQDVVSHRTVYDALRKYSREFRT